MTAHDLEELEKRVACDLDAIRFPDRTWVIPTKHPSGQHVHDVVVIGAGHCGLTVAFALLRRRITNIVVLDATEPGQQGPWNTYARMLTLRSPKHFNGPDLDVPSLTCQAWFSARYGAEAWELMHKIPKECWQEYLLWFRRVVGIPVEYSTQVDLVEPDPHDVLRITANDAEGERTLLARKVVFATGVTGTGAWQVPQVVRDNLPPNRYTQVADAVDFTQFTGCRIGVLGGGASAYDNAATALEHAASEVRLFFRRPQLHRVNPHKWTEFAGFLDHFCDLPDAWRWRFMRQVLPQNEPPPPETFRRATQHAGFHLHLGETWDEVGLDDDKVRVRTVVSSYVFDHLLVAVGLVQDVALQRELRTVRDHIARWSDRYQPPNHDRHDGLATFPYLGRHLEYVEREPGSAPYLRHLYNFTAAATVSHGPSGSSINGMKQAAQRVASGICRDLFCGSAIEYYQQLCAFDQPELDVAWPQENPDEPAATVLIGTTEQSS